MCYVVVYTGYISRSWRVWPKRVVYGCMVLRARSTHKGVQRLGQYVSAHLDSVLYGCAELLHIKGVCACSCAGVWELLHKAVSSSAMGMCLDKLPT